VFLGLLLFPASLRGADTFYAKVYLNAEDKGEYVVRLLGDGDFLVRTGDLAAMGLSIPEGEPVAFDGEPHFSLRSLKGVSFVFREKTLSLELTADPSLLPKRVFDFQPPRQPGVLYPKDSSAFFNYGVQYTAGDSSGFRQLDVGGEIGVRVRDSLFYTDAAYSRTPSKDRFVRLTSNVTYDRRREMQRWILGDFQASSGLPGSSVLLGGISFSREFRIDPYFIYYPSAGVSGKVAFPSTAEVYLDGTRLRTLTLAPGEFDLRNITYYGGMGTVSVVTRDLYGREATLRYPYYFTDTVLREGLHDYSYNIGFRRRDFGEESNRYGPPAFSAVHNYGLTDSLTVGVRGEGDDQAANLGPQASYRTGRAGVVSLSLAGSVARGAGGGAAIVANHQYQNRNLGTRLFFLGRTREYATIGEAAPGATPRSDVGAGVSYGTGSAGTVSVDYADRRTYDGPDLRIVTAGYAKTLRPGLAVQLTFRNIHRQTTENDYFAGLTYYPGSDTTISAGYRREGETGALTVQAQKNPPAGEGWGYLASVTSADTPLSTVTTVAPSVQYNARYGILRGAFLGEYSGSGENREQYLLSASGGIVWVGGEFGVSRPVTDSFGLVTVDNVSGVRVYQNNQDMGRTDSRGRLFLPAMGSYYENQITVADKDIPFDYSLGEVTKLVSPPLRSGSRIPFDVKRFQAVTGRLHIRRDGEQKPAEFLEIRLEAAGKPVAFPTGRGGEFYAEDLRPGVYAASVEDRGRRCLFELRVPETGEGITDLGVVTCEENR